MMTSLCSVEGGNDQENFACLCPTIASNFTVEDKDISGSSTHLVCLNILSLSLMIIVVSA